MLELLCVPCNSKRWIINWRRCKPGVTLQDICPNHCICPDQLWLLQNLRLNHPGLRIKSLQYRIYIRHVPSCWDGQCQHRPHVLKTISHQLYEGVIPSSRKNYLPPSITFFLLGIAGDPPCFQGLEPRCMSL